MNYKFLLPLESMHLQFYASSHHHEVNNCLINLLTIIFANSTTTILGKSQFSVWTISLFFFIFRKPIIVSLKMSSSCSQKYFKTHYSEVFLLTLHFWRIFGNLHFKRATFSLKESFHLRFIFFISKRIKKERFIYISFFFFYNGLRLIKSWVIGDS